MVAPSVSRKRRLARILSALAGVSLLLAIVLIVMASLHAPRRYFRAAMSFSVVPSSKLIFATSYERQLIKKFPNVRLNTYPGKNVINVVVTSGSPTSAQIDCSAAALAFVQNFENKYSRKVATTSKYGDIVVTVEEHSIIRDEIRPRADRLGNWFSSLWSQ